MASMVLPQPGRFGQGQQVLHGASGDAMLGEIHQQIAKPPGKGAEACGISGEQIAQMQISNGGVMGFQFLPDRQVAGNGHGQLPYVVLRD
jgi:hypothetical protein